MGVEDVAHEALVRGTVEPVSRSSFAPGEARALAIDSHDDVAAVLVVRRRRDDAWIVDVVSFLRADGRWRDVGLGGGTYGDLPFEYDEDAHPRLGPYGSAWAPGDDDGIVTAGGFVVGPVAAVELCFGLS